ncbi:MAG: alpha/beta fold hydrolase [Clostridia bacterium]|nr:alpha/beta fold hydrolase [Clostridia bacterium]
MCIVSALYKKFVVTRYDGDGIIKYYTYEDFSGLQAEPITFTTPQGIELKGNVYSYPGADEGALVVFAHGIGGGHRSYLREIERICRAGYRVAGYDNCGCFASGGKNIRGLTESLNDLVACIAWLRGQEKFAKAKISVIGHSWGGYAAANVLNYRKDIHAVVPISAFVSVKEFLNAFLTGKMRFMRRGVYRFERRANPDFVDSNAVDAVNDTGAKVLFVHSRDDGMVSISVGLDYVRDRVDNPKVRFLELDGKKHNPHYTADAVDYMNSRFGEYNRLVAEKKLKTDDEKRAFCADFDYWRMTEQDDEVWSAILDCIK